MTQLAECPSCATINEFADELIGRYAACQKCGCRFWVVVPPLDKGEAVVPPPNPQSIVMSRPKPTAAAATGKTNWPWVLFWVYFAAINIWAFQYLVRWLTDSN